MVCVFLGPSLHSRQALVVFYGFQERKRPVAYARLIFDGLQERSSACSTICEQQFRWSVVFLSFLTFRKALVAFNNWRKSALREASLQELTRRNFGSRLTICKRQQFAWSVFFLVFLDILDNLCYFSWFFTNCFVACARLTYDVLQGLQRGSLVAADDLVLKFFTPSLTSV